MDDFDPAFLEKGGAWAKIEVYFARYPKWGSRKDLVTHSLVKEEKTCKVYCPLGLKTSTTTSSLELTFAISLSFFLRHISLFRNLTIHAFSLDIFIMISFFLFLFLISFLRFSLILFLLSNRPHFLTCFTVSYRHLRFPCPKIYYPFLFFIFFFLLSFLFYFTRRFFLSFI